MTIGPRSRIGPYEVVALLGEGGMGKVWRAHHITLKRDDALKVLPDAFVSDPERLARFQREAQVLASINHPNIAHVYGLEEADGRWALVMELVEGPTLADRIARGPIPLDEALPIAKQIAEALEAAHEQGIIHRDIKPANVKLRPDGTVKVLDFGLAKALEPTSLGSIDVTASPTITAPALMTGAGVLLGTAAYMSPEQARGKTMDQRTDIWAFGCVLYELLTGKRAFGGDDVTDTLLAVMKGEPDWGALPADAPAGIVTLLRRCLQKDARRRIPHIGIARLEIDDVGMHEVERSPRAKGGASITTVAVATVGILALTAVTYFGSGSFRSQPNPPAYRASLLPAADASYALNNPEGFMALSPDGRRLAFIAATPGRQNMLWIRELDGLASQPLPGTEGASDPFWSPDSRSIAFFAQGRLLRIGAEGGPIRTVAENAVAAGGAWNQDDVILFRDTTSDVLHRVAASGGATATVTALDSAAAEVAHGFPVFLPDGIHFFFSSFTGRPGQAVRTSLGLRTRGVFVGSINSTERSQVLDEGVKVQYASGHLLYLRGGTLVAQRFDDARLTLTGGPAQIADQVVVGGFAGQGGAFTASTTGVLAYQSGSVPLSRLTWFDRSGREISVMGDPAEFGALELSPDGRRVIAAIVDPIKRTRDLWLYEVSRGVPTRLTFSDADDVRPVWAPDGKSIAFDSARGGTFDIYRKDITGAGAEQAIVGDAINERPFSWSSDGRYLIYESGSPKTPDAQFGDVWVIPFFDPRVPFAFLSTSFAEVRPLFSPDGSLVMYESDESGRNDVYVVRFPDGSDKVRVSQNGGSWTRWARDGREIFYLTADNTMMTVPISNTGGSIQVGTPSPLFKTRAKRVLHPYDVSPEGRFLINTLSEDTGRVPITLAVNWPATLE